LIFYGQIKFFGKMILSLMEGNFKKGKGPEGRPGSNSGEKNFS
jgi:hypothetical protein